MFRVRLNIFGDQLISHRLFHVQWAMLGTCNSADKECNNIKIKFKYYQNRFFDLVF